MIYEHMNVIKPKTKKKEAERTTTARTQTLFSGYLFVHINVLCIFMIPYFQLFFPLFHSYLSICLRLLYLHLRTFTHLHHIELCVMLFINIRQMCCAHMHMYAFLHIRPFFLIHSA